MGSFGSNINLMATVLCGGVGGARMARALAGILDPGNLTAVVNVGDDDDIYGVRVCADLDTVTYTLAGIQGPEGWGIADDTFTVMDHLAGLGGDTAFRLGDRDLALCLRRTEGLGRGEPLSAVTGGITRSLGVAMTVLPSTDDAVRTRLRTAGGEWLAFQDYFVRRSHADTVTEVHFEGADTASPAPGVVEAIDAADVVVIAPSNPVLSVWPILAVPAVAAAVRRHRRVVAVSPLFGGAALKGPAAAVLESLGLGAGNAAVLEAYAGLVTDLVVDEQDAADVARLTGSGVRIHAAPTRIADPADGRRFARWLVGAPTGAVA